MMLFTKRCLTGLFAVLGLSLLAFSAPVFAATQLRVMLTDGSGIMLSSETVEVHNETGQKVQEDDKKGAVTIFNDLPPGNYVVKVGNQILTTVNVSATDTVKRITVRAALKYVRGKIEGSTTEVNPQSAEVNPQSAAYTPALLAAGIGASVGVMAGLGSLLSTDGGGTEDEDVERQLCGVQRQLCANDVGTMSRALSDASDHVSGLMARSGLESSASGYGPPAFSPHTGLPVHKRRGLSPAASGSAFWLRAFGNRARYQAQGNLNPESGHLGLAAGYNLRLNATTQLGVLAGYYGQGELRFEGPQRFRPGPGLFKEPDPFAGVYVRRDFAPFSLQVGISGGTLRHASSRLVNGNLAPNGLARAEARTRSWWLAPEARVGLRLDRGLMEFEPSFTVRYARQSIQGFSETGSRAPATVGQRKVELLETRLELKASREMGPSRIALRLGWKYRDELNSSRARLLEESQQVRLGSGSGSSFYLGAETEYELVPGLFLNLSGEAVSGDGYRNMGGMASVYQTF